MSTENSRPRTSTLNGFSVKDQLDLWKKRDAAQNPGTGSKVINRAVNNEKLQVEVLNALTSDSPNVLGVTHSSKEPVVYLTAPHYLPPSPPRVSSQQSSPTKNKGVPAVKIFPSPTRASKVEVDTNRGLPIPPSQVSPPKSPPKIDIPLVLIENISPSSSISLMSVLPEVPIEPLALPVASHPVENQIFFDFITKLKAESLSQHEPKLGSKSRLLPLTATALSRAATTPLSNPVNESNSVPSTPLRSSSGSKLRSSQKREIIMSQVGELKELDKIEQTVHKLLEEKNRSDSATSADLETAVDGDRVRVTAHGGLSETKTLSGVPHSPHNSSSLAPNPRNREAVERILATMDQLPQIDAIKKNMKERERVREKDKEGREGNSLEKSTSRSTQGSKKERSRAPSPAVERLLTNIEQLKEMELLQNTVERLRAERGKKS